MEDFLIILQQITKKEPYEMTEADKEFLRARQSYLSDEEREKYAEVLSEIKAEEIKPVKKGRPKGRSN